MADELQALLNRITEDEWKKTDAQRAEVLQAAQKEAADIVKAAQKQAGEIQEAARKEAETMVRKGEESLRQAARDVLLSLRSELEKRVTQTVTALMKENCKGQNLADIIVKMLLAFMDKEGNTDDVTILVGREDLEAVEQRVKQALTEDMKAHCQFAPTATAGGFKLQFQESGVVYDFSDTSLAETLATFVGPKLAALLNA